MNKKLVNSIIENVSGEFSLIEQRGNIVSLMHNQTELPFQLIIGNEYLMGLSKDEEIAARNIVEDLPLDVEELRPIHYVKVKSFLISQTPLTNYQLSKIIKSWSYSEENKHTPANVNLSLIDDIQKMTKMRIPFEEEWEYACRGETKTLFVFGDEIPQDDILYKWLNCDFSDLKVLNENSFGLYGLFAGEWCGNYYRESYNSTIDQTEWRVLRGGGSLFYPWQDNEWIWCLSSMRMSSESLGKDGCAAFRLVKELSFENQD